jgi:hypothetical protein
MTTRTFQFTVSSGLPSYLPAANWQWVQVAAPSASRGMLNVMPSPAVAIANYTTDGQIDSWTGGCMDQVNKQLIRPANGGHTSYLGNEIYGVPLGVDLPAYLRLNNPTSNTILAESRNRTFPTVNADVLDDGTCPSLHHGAELQYQDGRVWVTFQTSTAGDDGNDPNRTTGFNGNWSIPAVMSWERATNTWRQHGRAHANPFNHSGFGKSAALSTQQKVFGFPNLTSILDNGYCEIDTAPGVAESLRVTRRTAPVPISQPGFAVGCPALNIVVVGRYDTNQIYVLNRNAGANTWVSVTAPHTFFWNEVTQSAESQGVFRVDTAFNAQPVYRHDTNTGTHSLLFFEANYNTTGIIRRLHIPVTGGAYNSSATTWSWSTIQSTSAPVGANVGGQSTYGRFNIIHNIGDGSTSVLVTHPSSTSPVYVCKIGTLS